MLFVYFKSDMQLPSRFSNDELYVYYFFYVKIDNLKILFEQVI